MNKTIYSNSDKEAALRRTLMRVKPEYFSWSKDEQEQYGANIPEDEDFRITQSLYKILFNIDVSTEESVKVVNEDFSGADYLLFNSTILPLNGIGEDDFFLNESMSKTLLDFETLHDYYYEDYLFQEEVRSRDFKNYKPRPYQGRIHCDWARLKINGDFYYALLWSATDYLISNIDNVGEQKIDELIPHNLVEGKNHGKREKSGTLWNMEWEAGGLESQLEELRFRHHNYVNDLEVRLSDDFDEKTLQEAYMIEDSKKDDPTMHFIFSNKTALEAVKFKSFIRDCQRINGDCTTFDLIGEREKKAIMEFLEQQYHDIMENFDPKIAKFHKKKKVIVLDKVDKSLL